MLVRQLNLLPHRTSYIITPEEESTFAVLYPAHNMKFCTSGLFDFEAVFGIWRPRLQHTVMTWASAIAALPYYSNVCNYYQFRFLINVYSENIGSPLFVWMDLLVRGLAYLFITIAIWCQIYTVLINLLLFNMD